MAKKTQRPRRILRRERQSSRLSREQQISRPHCGLCGSTENLNCLPEDVAKLVKSTPT
jgi:hypothetical protein